MKNLVLILLLLLSIPAKAQLNLVPNPSFEDTVYCPYGLTQIDAATGWSSYRDSPDYYNACGPIYISVPNANFGYQYANSGTAYIGMETYLHNSHPLGNNYREYAGTELISPLQIGTKYYFSFYAVLAERYTGFASNNLGLRFFTNSYSLSNPAPLDNFSHLKFDSLLTDSINWHKVSGSFVADSNYQYICIGNFYDYLNTDTLIVTPFSTIAYYYVDDICVTTDSLYNEVWTGIEKLKESEIHISPNPSNGIIEFKSNLNGIYLMSVYNVLGEKILTRNMEMQNRAIIDLSELKDGLYFITIENRKQSKVLKFIKQ